MFDLWTLTSLDLSKQLPVREMTNILHTFIYRISGLIWLVRSGSISTDDNSMASFWQSLLENRGCNNAIKGKVMKYTSCFYLLVIL